MIQPIIGASGYDVYPPKPASWLLAEVTVANCRPGYDVLDACAGSGVVGLSVGVNTAAHVTCIDRSGDAMLAIQQNSEFNGLRLRVLRGDMYAPVAGEHFDIIAVHPPAVPYQASNAWGLSPGMELATNGGWDGSELVLRSIRESKNLLKPGGMFLLLLPHWSNLLAARSAMGVNYPNYSTEAQQLVEFFPAIEGTCGKEQLDYVHALADRGVIELKDGKSTVSVLKGIKC